jgi:hypothetical protein
VTELRCNRCGGPADLVPIGPKGFSACRSCDQVLKCIRCGQFVVFCGGRPPDHPELASGVCSECRMRERADGLQEADLKAILAAASSGVIPAIKVVRERLGWSLQDAVSLLNVLGIHAELT